MKKSLTYLFVIMSFYLVSCDPQTDYKMIVQNKSSHEITVNQKYKIASGNEAAIYEYLGVGGPGSNSKCELPLGDGVISAEVTSRTDLKININLADMNNWTYSKTKDGWKGHKARCITTIADADIVAK